MSRLDEIYLERCRTTSDIYEHLPFIHDLVVAENAQTVVELGVRSGNSTAALVAAVSKTGGAVWSVDTAVPSWPREFYGAPNLTLIIGDDMKVADQLPDQIDVLFIDTTHWYEHTLAELNLYGPRSTIILLHDTELEEPYQMPATDPRFPVKTAIKDWTAKTGRPWANRTNCYGLGIIR